MFNRKENFKAIEQENPNFATIIRLNAYMRDFNKDYEEIHEEDEIATQTSIRLLSDRGLVFDRLGYL